MERELHFSVNPSKCIYLYTMACQNCFEHFLPARNRLVFEQTYSIVSPWARITIDRTIWHYRHHVTTDGLGMTNCKNLRKKTVQFHLFTFGDFFEIYIILWRSYFHFIYTGCTLWEYHISQFHKICTIKQIVVATFIVGMYQWIGLVYQGHGFKVCRWCKI